MADLSPDIESALQSSAVVEVLRSLIEPIVFEAVERAITRNATDRLLSYKEAAVFLGMTYGSLRSAISRDASLAKLATGSGRLRRFRRIDLERWQGERQPTRSRSSSCP